MALCGSRTGRSPPTTRSSPTGSGGRSCCVDPGPTSTGYYDIARTTTRHDECAPQWHGPRRRVARLQAHPALDRGRGGPRRPGRAPLPRQRRGARRRRARPGRHATSPSARWCVDVVKEIDRCVIVTRPQPGLDARQLGAHPGDGPARRQLRRGRAGGRRRPDQRRRRPRAGLITRRPTWPPNGAGRAGCPALAAPGRPPAAGSTRRRTRDARRPGTRRPGSARAGRWPAGRA